MKNELIKLKSMNEVVREPLPDPSFYDALKLGVYKLKNGTIINEKNECLIF